MASFESYSILSKNKRQKALFLLLCAVVLVLIGYIFQYYFWPFLFALILYIALRPLCDRLSRIIHNRTAGAFIIILLLIGLVLVPIFYLLIALANQAYEFYSMIQGSITIQQVQDYIQSNPLISRMYGYFNIEKGELVQKGADLLQKTSFEIFINLKDILSFSVHFTVNVLFMLLIIFFLLKDGQRMDESFYRILPFPEDIEKEVINRLKEVIKLLLAGNLFIMLLQGFFVGLGLYLFNVDMPLLWGSLAAMLSLIPVIGTACVWIPSVIYLSAIGNYAGALFVGIWCLFWYLVLENVVKAKLFGKKLRFHPLIFFFLMLGSIQTFGVAGILIGPIILTLFFSLWEIYKLVDTHQANQGSKPGKRSIR